jgi:beta-mannosidase
MTIGWQLRKQYVKWTGIFFHEILPNLLTELTGKTVSEIPYIPTSPTSGIGFLKSVNADHSGNTHLWHVWHGLRPLNYYRKRFTRFCSEFGLESLPDKRTVASFFEGADEEELAKTLKASPKQVLKMPLFMAHQKCMSGNAKMLFYVSERFRLPAQFEDAIYLTQITQAICIEDATEHWRRNCGLSNGSIYWQYNDCWPVSSWSSIDFYDRPKALYYRAKHFNAAVSVSIEDSKNKASLYILNDTLTEKQLLIRYKLMSFSGEIIKKAEAKIIAQPLKSNLIDTLDFTAQLKTAKRNLLLYVEILDEKGTVLNSKTCLFGKEKRLAMPRPVMSATVEVEADVVKITVKTKNFARYVQICVESDKIPALSDNYFDMLPGETKIITAPANGMSAEELTPLVKVKSVADIPPAGSLLSDKMFRIKVRSVPINLANSFVYRFIV